MNIAFHPRVLFEVQAIMRYYEDVADVELAKEFYQEFSDSIAEAAQHPETFRSRAGGFKRGNLKRFPYNFLFRQVRGQIRILVVRHHARHPAYGTGRK